MLTLKVIYKIDRETLKTFNFHVKFVILIHF